jgi:hypothetical protein
VGEVALLDAGDAPADGVEDARGALGVGGDRLAAVAPALIHHGPDLLFEESLVLGLVVGAGHALGGADLDHVGARAQHPAHGETGLVHGVGQLGHLATAQGVARRSAVSG